MDVVRISRTNATESSKDLPKAKMPNEQESIQRQVSAAGKAIDTLVHELCGLPEEEVRIAEREAK